MEMLAIILLSILWILLIHTAPAALDRRLEPALVRVNPVRYRRRSLQRLKVPYGG